jgi:hypothetical protein
MRNFHDKLEMRQNPIDLPGNPPLVCAPMKTASILVVGTRVGKAV